MEADVKEQHTKAKQAMLATRDPVQQLQGKTTRIRRLELENKDNSPKYRALMEEIDQKEKERIALRDKIQSNQAEVSRLKTEADRLKIDESAGSGAGQLDELN